MRHSLDQHDQVVISALVALSQSTSAAILTFYCQRHKLNTQHKANDTPLTDADIVAHHLLTQELPNIIDLPIVSEESSHEQQQMNYDDYWLIDPIDGTRNFIEEVDEFCIAIARIQAGRPILGLIYKPVTHQYWFALKNKGAYTGHAQADGSLLLSPIHSSPLITTPRIITSRFHRSIKLQHFIEQAVGQHEHIYLGSALKFCAIAEGKADLYPKLSATTCQWDIAAGDVIISEAGGGIMIAGEQTILYGADFSLINPPFIAYGAGISASDLDTYQHFISTH